MESENTSDKDQAKALNKTDAPMESNFFFKRCFFKSDNLN
jgi:hypothetical protein